VYGPMFADSTRWSADIERIQQASIRVTGGRVLIVCLATADWIGVATMPPHLDPTIPEQAAKEVPMPRLRTADGD
jgi:hypothetical protein